MRSGAHSRHSGRESQLRKIAPEPWPTGGAPGRSIAANGVRIGRVIRSAGRRGRAPSWPGLSGPSSLGSKLKEDVKCQARRYSDSRKSGIDAVAGRTDQRAGAAQHPHQLKRERRDLIKKAPPLAHSGQCRSRRRPVDSFFPALLFGAGTVMSTLRAFRQRPPEWPRPRLSRSRAFRAL
jgi:hypothetical protein